MIIRVRTNVGVSRVDISENATVAELRERVLNALRIQAPLDAVVLSTDLEHRNVLADDAFTLSKYNIHHGMEIFVVGKFEKRTVDKSFVNSDGAVVQAGTSLHMVDEGGKDIAFGHTTDSQGEQNAAVPIAKDRTAAPAPNPAPLTQASASAAQEGADPPAPAEDFEYVDYGDLRDYSDLDSGIRAPDPAQRMTLLEDPSMHGLRGGHYEDEGAEFNLVNTPGGRSLMHAVLTDQELAQVGQLERTLREAGMREYDVQLEVQNLQDELIARRLQRDSVPYGDTVAKALLQTGATQEDVEQQMRHMDRTLERYHAGGSTRSLRQQQQQGEVLRLQEFQGTNKQHQQQQQQQQSKTVAPIAPALAVKGKGAPMHQVLAVDSGGSGRSNGGGGGSASPSQHSELTSSVTSGTPAPAPRRRAPTAAAAAGAGAAAVKTRQPSAAFAAATRASDPPVARRESGPKEGGGVHNGDGGMVSKLSALQRNALRSLSAPGSDQQAAATATDLDSSEVSRRRQQGDELRALASQLASFSQGQGEQGRPLRETAPGKGEPRSGEKGQPPAQAPSRRDGQAGGRAAGAAPPASAPRSLRDSGYKSMAQIKQLKQPAAAAAAPERKAAVPSFSSKKHSADPAPETQLKMGPTRSNSAKAPGSVPAVAPATGIPASRATAERQPAPYSMREVRGVLEGASRSGGPTAAPVSRSGGVATTVVTKPSGAAQEDFGSAEDLDDTLALALQLSLEDSRPVRTQRAAGTADSSNERYNGIRDDYTSYNFPAYDDAVAAADAAILEARRVQEQLDAEAAEEMLRYEAEHAAAEREYEEQLARQARRPLLQQRLQYGARGAVPGQMQSLDRAMTEDANAGLLDLAAAESFAQHDFGHGGGYGGAPYARAAPHQPRQQRPGWTGGVGADDGYLPAQRQAGDGNPPEVFFDQEDELLARAIQDSLNDQEGWQY